MSYAQYYPYASEAEWRSSAARVQAGQVFKGEDLYTYNSGRHFRRHRMAESSSCYEPRKSSTIPPSENLLLQKFTKKWVSIPCTICHLVFMPHMKIDMSGEVPWVNRIQAVPRYVMSDGHAFHEACLFSYLTEPSEQNFVTCDKCEIVKAWVAVHHLSSLDVEAAMDNVPMMLSQSNLTASE